MDYITKQQYDHPFIDNSLEEKSNFLNRLFFVWVNKIINFGNTYEFNYKNLFQVQNDMKYEYVTDKFFQTLEKQKIKDNKISLQKIFWIMYKKDIFNILTFITFAQCFQFAGPIIMGEISMNINNSENRRTFDVFFYPLLIFFVFFVRVLFQQHCFHILNKVSFQCITCLQASIVDKVLKMKKCNRKNYDTGNVLNLSSKDVNEIQSFCLTGGIYLVVAPIMILISTILILLKVSYIGIFGFFIIIISSLLNRNITKLVQACRKIELKFADLRLQYLTEYFNGIKLIKYYGWENHAINSIMNLRNQETTLIFKETFYRAVIEIIGSMIPILISVLVFGFYVSINQLLTPQIPILTSSILLLSHEQNSYQYITIQSIKNLTNFQYKQAFVTLGLFNLLTNPIKLLGFAMVGFSNLIISFKRLNGFLDYEIDNSIDENTYQLDESQQYSVQMENDCCFDWSDSNQSISQKIVKKDQLILKNTCFSLKNINLDIKQGQKVSVVGQVGSGKSSLIYAILGEMNKQKGQVRTNGKIAFVAQTAWMQNSSLKDNIIFGKPYNEQKYQEILRISQLNHDLSMLQKQDQTLIGEKGNNLSGGQKQRISIARALYSDSDIYILDDCFSALDSDISLKIFNEVIYNYLKKKTVIFVTNSINYASQADYIIVMVNGNIQEQDYSSKLIGDKNSMFNQLQLDLIDNIDIQENLGFRNQIHETKQIKNFEKKQKHMHVQQLKFSEQQFKLHQDDELTVKIAQKENLLNFKSFSDYIKSGNQNKFIISLLLITFSGICISANSLWLAAWSIKFFDIQNLEFVGIFMIIASIQIIVIFLSSFSFIFFSRQASITLQRNMLYSIFRSPMQFFDQTPSGQLIDRCSKDQEEVDLGLPQQLKYCLDNVLLVCCLFLLAITILPLYSLAFLIFLPFFIKIASQYMTGIVYKSTFCNYFL